ncbi:MAG: hypothetical protein M1817_006123 [Caeruleum heppii]|nr:MAG: hypothetical protein M1817_006123 [Caeruleum heppii]
MLDNSLRRFKDDIFVPCTAIIPSFVTPNHITAAAFIAGLLSCIAIAVFKSVPWAALLWTLNRALDCVDGALARRRQTASDLGGFLDLLGDFIIYSMVPLSAAWSRQDAMTSSEWAAVVTVEASFHINNFVLFYVAAVAEQRSEQALTSVVMQPALVEGFEAGTLFTCMLLLPDYIGMWCWIMAAAVAVGTVQRLVWVLPVLVAMKEKKKS